MSDWGAQHNGVGSALAGLDMAMPGDGGRGTYNSLWGGALTEAVLDGTIPQWRLDDMVIRIMAAYFKVHVGNKTERVPINFSAWTNQTYGPLYPSSNSSVALVNEHINVQADHGALIREMGAKSTVLLKNVNGTLPLMKPASIAIIGEDAQDNPAGPNACADRGCNVGTLAMAWGSGTADFPYLISPATALQTQATKDGTRLINVKGNYDLEAARRAAANVSTAIVFANANAGENYITIGGNAGDRNNLTLWNGGDELVKAVASANPNTILVLHTVGPVLIEAYKNHPNITAILWAGLPGQESGNSLVDVLYGKTNPQAKTPFTWGKAPADWGVSLMYTSPTPQLPQQEFPNGLLIDHRYFDAKSITPSYEFGFGLSYTTFAFSNISVQGQPAKPYKAATGATQPAPIYGTIDKEAKNAMAPAGFVKLPRYVYPYLTNAGLTGAAKAAVIPAGSREDTPQPLLPAGGAPGGNPGLYEVIYTVSASVTNIGKAAGAEIAQLVSQSRSTPP
jgi:beta-glucosidase